MSYTDAQRNCIENYNEHKLVCAGPGSGKTHTVIGLVENIIENESSASVLLVTFTNAAAKEMLARLEKRLGKDVVKQKCVVSTFASIMIKHSREGSEDFKKGVIGGRRLCFGTQAKPFMQNAFRELRITEFKDKREAEAQINDASKMLDISELDADIQQVIRAYNKALASARAIDLDGLVRELVSAIKEDKIRCYPFSHIIVDEFQDTDSLQYEWLRLHGKNGSIITVVGDDDQSVYSWRQSAGYENIAEMMIDFEVVPTILDDCFRCPPEVLKASNTLIEHNEERVPKQMKSKLNPGGIVDFMPIGNECINEAIERLVIYQNERNINPKPFLDSIDAIRVASKTADLSYLRAIDVVLKSPGEWTILARSNLMLDEIEKQLSMLGAPLIRLGGKSIWDNELVNAFVMAIYVVFIKKNASILGSFLAWAGESSTTISEIMAQTRNVAFTACATAGNDTSWNSLTMSLHHLCLSVLHNDIKEKEALNQIFEMVCAAEIKNQSMNGERLENFKNSAKKLWGFVLSVFHGTDGTSATKAQKLSDRARNTSKKETNLSSRTNEVVLTTMNNSKGLEFKRVLIHRVESMTVPSKISYTTECIEPSPPVDKDGMEIDKDEFYHRIGEERRLLYVAMTRAEHQLMLTYRQEKGSGFLKEVFGEQDFDVLPAHLQE
ncbi:UvrD-helicase domain-containing protein [Aliidiomarina quisquiliarum]|uniref:UvrD-helicase domain-containing protein n=1 Tax=Aliidiomarina quisquiliarum TaxID=2938947 RepID=UPI00208DE680|nr:ATP-dependent helicase [Aliidiomarina quisquiliarum]MCO4319953.1 ATP-dependent helicase [Aliidiomarina quisquiliarum]